MQHDRPSSGVFVGGFLLAALALIFVPLATIGVVAAVRDDPADPPTAGADESPVGDALVAEVALSEFSITGELTVPAGPVTLGVTNDGSTDHDLVLRDGPSTPLIQPGERVELDLGDLEPGTYELYCSIPGHLESGMRAELVVVEDPDQAGDSASGTDDGHADHDTDWAAMDEAMLTSMTAFPAATEGRGNPPLEPTVLADGTKEFELTAAVTPWEVEPGRVVDAWTYNGVVPGPEIRVQPGDQVRVVVHNELPVLTDVHWHGIAVPNEMDGVAPLTQDPIEPGDTFVYEFEARRPAIGMYHAHMHGHVAIPNGLFGVFIIEGVEPPAGATVSGTTIPEDLEVSQEIPMVLNDAGVIGFSLNGKSFPATDPYEASTGDWVVIHYYNEGLMVHPMHLHQFPQLVYAKDGMALDQPYYAYTVNVAPGERYSVLVNLDEAGTWVWHCHIITHVERDTGMFGMVTAFIVD